MSTSLLRMLIIGLLLFVSTQAQSIRIDKNHSTVGFAVPIVGGISEVTGKFSDFEIDLVWDKNDLSKFKVTASLKTSSIDTGIDDRDDHLRSEDFFDAEKYPEIKFESEKIIKDGDHYKVPGKLTMKGVTKDVELPLVINDHSSEVKGEMKTWYSFSSKLIVDRTEYGIDWEHGIVPFFVGDDVEVRLVILTR